VHSASYFELLIELNHACKRVVAFSTFSVFVLTSEFFNNYLFQNIEITLLHDAYKKMYLS